MTWSGRFTFPCMSLTLFPLIYDIVTRNGFFQSVSCDYVYKYLVSPAIINVITIFSYLNCYLYSP